MCWSPSDAVASDHTLGGSVRPADRTPSWFWRLAICNRGVSRATAALRAPGENLSHAFLLASSAASAPGDSSV